MTTSILNDCLLLKNETPESLQEYLKKINLTIFDPIFHNSQNLKEAQQKVLFILCGFSEDSPLLILRQDSKEEKEGICEYLQIPEYMRGALLALSEKEVREASLTYLEQFAGYDFKTLMFFKIQYDDFMRDTTNRNYREADGEEGEKIQFNYDIKEHGKALKEMQNLSRSIMQLEDRIKATVTHSALQEVKDWRQRGKGKTIRMGSSGISIEHSSLIKRHTNG